jgi:hypothetical protein
MPEFGKAGAFSCSELAFCSLGNLGIRTHSLLSDLTAHDHTIYPRKAIAESIAGQWTFDDVIATILRTPLIKDTSGNDRVAIAAASPHVGITGDLDVSGHAAFGNGSTPNSGRTINVIDTLTTHPATAAYMLVTGNRAAGPQFTYGLSGGAVAQGTPSAAYVYGLYYFAQHNTASPCYQLGGILVQIQSGVSGVGVLSTARGLQLSAAYWGGSKPDVVMGVEQEQLGGAGAVTAYGYKCVDQTATTVRLLELGPATPYLRLLGGANPAANQSNLLLKLGATLKLITEYGVDTAGVGYRALRVPN